MSNTPEQSLEAGPEQVLYAKVLEKGMYLGLLLIFVTYLIYVLGILSPYLPHGEVPQLWGLSVSEYLEKTNIHAGWSWVGMLHYGDFVPIGDLQ